MDKLIQSYEVTKQIGAGGMATVFMGRQPALNRSVAIKVVKGDHKDKVKRFEREASLSASLKQENLPAIYDYFIDGKNNHCLVMEYVEGIDLSDIIKQEGSIPPFIGAIVIREIARGLEHLHEKGILHRDIKPSNVRLTTDGQIKLMDFGIAKHEESDQKNLTSTGIIIGTPSYMSPEQASGDKLTVQSDLFSVGIMMYEMLAGKKPFTADTNLTLITLIAQCRFEPLDKAKEGLPPTLIQIVHTCMTRELSHRYRQAGAIVKDLNDYLESISQSEIRALLRQFYEAVTGRNKDVLRQFGTLGRRTASGPLKSQTSPTDYTRFRFSKGPSRKTMMVGGIVAFVLMVVTFGVFFREAIFGSDDGFGRVDVTLQANKWRVLPDTRIYANDREVPLGENFNGRLILDRFKKGRNSVRVRFPLLYQTYEYNFNLDDPLDRKELVVDVDRLYGVLDLYRPESRKFGFVADSKPAGAFVYLNNDLKNIFSKTPSPQTWPNVRTGSHKLSFQKEGYVAVELDRSFLPNENLYLQVELQPKKK